MTAGPIVADLLIAVACCSSAKVAGPGSGDGIPTEEETPVSSAARDAARVSQHTGLTLRAALTLGGQLTRSRIASQDGPAFSS